MVSWKSAVGMGGQRARKVSNRSKPLQFPSPAMREGRACWGALGCMNGFSQEPGGELAGRTCWLNPQGWGRGLGKKGRLAGPPPAEIPYGLRKTLAVALWEVEGPPPPPRWVALSFRHDPSPMGRGFTDSRLAVGPPPPGQELDLRHQQLALPPMQCRLHLPVGALPHQARPTTAFPQVFLNKIFL